MDSAKAKQKMIKARANLVMGEPFFGMLALRLKVIESERNKTMWTDGIHLGYHPEFVNKLTLGQCTAVVAHEVLHCAFFHQFRIGNRSHGRWNHACDYTVNNILDNARFDLPKDGLLINHQWDGISTDEIYTKLPPDPPGSQGSAYSNPGMGEVMPDPNQGGQGQPQNQAQAKANEADWKLAVTQAATVAKQAGRLPAGLEELIDELLQPVLPWKNILRRFLTEKANDNFSWARPNRRMISSGLYLPSRQSEATGDVVVAIDTSGSVSSEELQAFGNELAGIIQDVRPRETIVIYCDAAVNRVDRFAPTDPLHLHAVGRGGTDFRPPFDWIEKEGITPKAFVYLTDGYGPFPDEQGFPTLWVINNREVSPPWGEHLTLDMEAS